MIFSLILATIASGCNLKFGRDDDDKKQRPPKASAPSDGSIHLSANEIQAIGLRTARVIEQPVPISIDAVGVVTPGPGSEAQVFSPFAGRLILDLNRIPRIGSAVRKDQVIADVEQQLNVVEKTQVGANIAQLDATIVQARQEVTFRETEVDRVKRLYDQGGIALKTFQAAEFNLQQARAQLDGATRAKAVYEAAESRQSGPRRATITAPISGTVVSSDLTSGQMTDPTKNLLTIVNLRYVWVDASVHETDIPAVRKARTAVITSPANPGRSYSAKLITISDVIDKVNRTAQVIFAVGNRDLSLKIGMSAKVQIQIGTKTAGMLVPASAVILSEGQPAIYVETSPGIYLKRLVTVGERISEQVEVTSGLSSGETVVTVGAQALLGEASMSQIPRADD